MINPISFLWRQFNGPQITAICQALFEYFKESFDTRLNYFDRLTIESANSDHLTFIGILQSLARPLIPIPDEDMFWFTEEHGYIDDEDHPGERIPDTEYPSKHGLAHEGDTYGDAGKFDYEKFTTGYHYIPDYIFRCILQGNARSEGYIGGLIALDDILFKIWRYEHPTTPPVYTFRWATEEDERYTRADVFVNLGMTGDWAYPYETQAEVRLLGKTVYYPIPKLIPVMYEGDSQVDPTGWIRILNKTEYTPEGEVITYGLSPSMWENEGTPSDYIANGEEPEFEATPLTLTEIQLMWAQNNTWIDEEAPVLEMVSLKLDEIEDMWKG